MIVVLIDMMSIGLIVPVLPALVGRFTTSPAEQTWWYGAVTFSFALASFFGAPFLGSLSDRFGRRPILLLGFCGLAINFFTTALATSVWMLIASRVVGGGMQANAAVANAYVADISRPEERAKRFGMIDLQLPFFLAGGLALVNLAYGWFVLPESLPVERRRSLTWRAANPVASLRDLAKLKGVGMLVAVIACVGLAQFTLYTTWVLYTTFKFGWGPTQNGWSLFAVGIVAALVQGVLLGRLLKRFSPQRLALLGLTSSALAYALWGLASEGWMMYAVIFANLLGATVAANMQGIVSKAADASSQGQTMGAVSSLNSLMAVVAPMLAAPLLGAVSHMPPGDWRIGAPMFFCSALVALALALAWTHFRASRRPAVAPAAS
jgi:DHA1 family tetracycline resistance protein-like MFS transporter